MNILVTHSNSPAGCAMRIEAHKTKLDKYIFTDRIIPEHRQDFVYLLENSGARMKTLQDLGYNVECFGKYVVGY